MPSTSPESAIAIFGPGLLGGSLALAIRQRFPTARVHIWARREEALNAVRRATAADVTTTDPVEAVQGASLVVLATPVEHMASFAMKIAPHLTSGTVVTDVGSVKGPLVRSLSSALAAGPARFVGSHPMAGSEKTGFNAARADLFDGATCIVTPEADSPAPVVERIHSFWRSLGCRVLAMSAEEHDRKIARISHLPHAVAAAVVRAAMVADPSAAQCTGNGFRDATRIAAGDPSLWTGILLENRAEVLAALHDAQREVAELVEILDRMDEEALRHYLACAQSLRAQVPAAPINPNGPD